jgi:nucleoside transporter
MNVVLRTRLSAMMFLEYFIWGAWSVTMGTWLGQQLHFSGEQIAWAGGTTAVGAILSPFFVGLVADRWCATERVLAVLHIVGGVLLFVAAQQQQFSIFYAALLLYALCFMPTLALTNSLAFRQMSSTQKQFGAIRVFGTLGWIVAGLIIGNLHIEATALPMRLAAASSLLMGVYCWTLPHTPPLATTEEITWRHVVPPEALRLFRSRAMAVFAIASFLICVPLQFYYVFTNPFLNEVGVHDAAAKMTGGQMGELVCLLMIGWFFARLGVKYMLALGMFAWVVRYMLFAYGNSGPLMWMLWGGILLHGFCYDFFFVTGQIYIDREAPAQLRAATQGIITLITYGAGMLVGSWVSGPVVDANVHRTAGGLVGHDWHNVWMIAAGCAAVVLVFFLTTFSEGEKRRVPSVPAVAEEYSKSVVP